MNCPNCKEEIHYGFKLYMKSFFGQFKCPNCSSKLALTKRSSELVLFGIAVGILFAIDLAPEFEYQIHAEIAWIVVILLLLAIEFHYYRKQQPRLK